ncbi:class I SAM-dependent methyltransferase [Sanguibacter gelidistatuariae]|nr:class I SAM-dependent methyltransferase [Sanguibacter gelidistatuariae]
MLELDALVHKGYLTDVTTWLQGLAADAGVQRVLDVGAGAGSGTIALAQRFPEANVVATDLSEGMLERVRSLADASGLAGRVSTELADIGADVARLGTFDLAWASASLHEVGDPDRAFRNLRDALRPGGLLAVVEMDSPPRMLPLDLADFEDRLYAAFAHASQGNAYHPDWTDPLYRSGFELEVRRTFMIDEPADGRGRAGEYATLYLSRIAQASTANLDDADRALLTTLLGDGPDGLRQRADLRLRGSRTAWIARRP